MKVRNLTELFSQNANRPEVNSQAAANRDSKAQSGAAINPEAVRLAQDFGRGSAELQTPERQQQIARLKEQVSSGSYRVDSGKLAQKVAEELLI